MGQSNASLLHDHRGFSFAEFVLDSDRAALFQSGTDVNLRPQSFDVLRILVERQGTLVTKEELQQEIWGETAVTDDSLTHCIIDIRKVLDDSDRQIVKTVPRRGFVFDIPVVRHEPRRPPLGGYSPALVAVLAIAIVAMTAILGLRAISGSGPEVPLEVFRWEDEHEEEPDQHQREDQDWSHQDLASGEAALPTADPQVGRKNDRHCRAESDDVAVVVQ